MIYGLIMSITGIGMCISMVITDNKTSDLSYSIQVFYTFSIQTRFFTLFYVNKHYR